MEFFFQRKKKNLITLAKRIFPNFVAIQALPRGVEARYTVYNMPVYDVFIRVNRVAAPFYTGIPVRSA